MDFILACLFLMGIVVAFISLIWLVIVMIKHKTKRIPIILLITSFIIIIPTYIHFSLDSTTDTGTSNSINSKQSNGSVNSFNEPVILLNNKNNQKVKMTVQNVR